MASPEWDSVTGSWDTGYYSTWEWNQTAHAIDPVSIESSEAFGEFDVNYANSIRMLVGIPSAEAFGGFDLGWTMDMSEIPSEESFGQFYCLYDWYVLHPPKDGNWSCKTKSENDWQCVEKPDDSHWTC
jgi:hypothetical protein